MPTRVLEALLQPLESSQELLHGPALSAGELLVDRRELGQDLLPAGEADAHRLAGGELPVQRRLLLQEPDAAAGAQGHHALVGQVDAGEDPQQRGLAGSIAPHEPHPLALIKLEADALEEGPVVEPLGSVLEGNERHGGHGPRFAPPGQGQGVWLS